VLLICPNCVTNIIKKFIKNRVRWESIFVGLIMEGNPIFVYVGMAIFILMTVYWNIRIREKKRIARRDYYREYLKSDAWKRKRYVVLKRDNHKCQICGDKATQVHHLRYAKHQIGKEPIDWLISICKPCHEKQH
tara:strand:+ start:117 stop:518 length:402 start_codon:yes stop_codon:yes gene_type:complete